MFVYKYMGCVANVVLINSLSLNKLLRCLRPLHNRTCTRAHRTIVTTVTLLASLVIPAWSTYGLAIAGIYRVQFSRVQCMCWSLFTETARPWHYTFSFAIATVLNALPCTALCAMNVFLICFALKKSARVVKKTNIIIVLLVTVMFLLPMLPYYVYYSVTGYDWEEEDYVRYVTFVMFVASWANPPIYLITNDNFWKFTVRLFRNNQVRDASESGTFRRNQLARISSRTRLPQQNSPQKFRLERLNRNIDMGVCPVSYNNDLVLSNLDKQLQVDLCMV